MKTLVATAVVAIGIACVAAPPALLAQQKTAKECREEWRANKDANKASGITERDYVAKCRGAAAAAKPGAEPAAAPAPSGQTKSAKECRDEWRANKGANKAAGVTEKDYVAKCRGEGTAATQPPAAAPAPSAAAPAPPAQQPAPSAAAPAARPSAAAPKNAPTAAATPSGANQYASEAQAKTRCPSDTVVWVNLDSKIYHFSGNRNYGATKEGAYMCEKDAVGQSFNAAKNEKHP